jgi:DNA repair photolyase
MARSGFHKGRGAVSNTDGRYESIVHEYFDDGWSQDAETVLPKSPTRVIDEKPKSILAYNQSPDIPFDQSLNAYRGCEHGCIYCFARPTHAYLGLSPGLDFETRLFAKPNAPELLRDALSKPNYHCRVLALGTNTDPYQPIERQRQITRQVLQILAELEHPVAITTKSALVERDLDLLAPMAANGLAEVHVSVTTLDRHLARHMEPRATAPQRRLEAVRALSDAGVPVGVMIAPVVPFLTDHEIEDIVEAAAHAGARRAAYLMLRLPLEVKDLFSEWLRAHYPDKAAHVMSRQRALRGGRENDSRFGFRHSGQGEFADLIRQRFRRAVNRHGLDAPLPELNTERFRPPARDNQLSLFD